MKFYKCSHCGNLLVYFDKKACNVVCCGEDVPELVPNTTDAAKEKHVPDVKVDGDTVTVTIGSVEHPMIDAHYIEFIILETENGFQKKDLKPGDKPVAVFKLAEGEKAVAAYDYCNLHGLWKADI
jgi:superoxide reductase